MANENNDDMKEFEEEFDFESEESGTDALPIDDEDALTQPKGPEQYASESGVAIERKPSKLPWIIGLAAASFIGYQAYKIMFGQPKDEVAVPAVKEQATKSVPPATKPEQAQPATLPGQTASSTLPDLQGMPVGSTPAAQAGAPKTPDLFTAPPPASMPGATPPTAAVPPVPGQLEALEENFKKSQEKMTKLESKFSELMDAMGSLNQGMSQVTRELSTVSDSVQKLNKDVKTLKTQPQPAQQPPAQPSQAQKPQNTEENYSHNKYETKPAPSSQMGVSGTPTMSVHAIIPGRAWLKSKDGSTITVTEGDTLDRYGKILVIDASNAVVITSSGVTLR